MAPHSCSLAYTCLIFAYNRGVNVPDFGLCDFAVRRTECRECISPPDAQRAMARRSGAEVTEAQGSHAIYVSNLEVVAAVIKQAAVGVRALVR